MTNYITNSTLKRTFQVVRILGRSSVSDIGRFSNVDSLGLNGYTPGLTSVRYKSGKSSTNDKSKDIASILGPVNVKLNADKDGVNIGAELTGKLEQGDIVKILNKFYRRKEVKQIAAASGIDAKLFYQSYVSFRRFCIESDVLPDELHITYSDIIRGAGHEDDLLPYFMEHAKQMYPHLDCMDDLIKISDMSLPANWYPEARAITRKVIFHAGPTNSGKTYHALKRLKEAKSGIYCGPLRMLANEVFQKLNAEGITCDLITGEDRRCMGPDGEQSSHVASTVEMTSTIVPYEVAVIDEIQMMRDPSRSWAWTRALLGICANEVHLCGEASAVDYVRELVESIGDQFETKSYKRLTSLKVQRKGVDNLANIQPGDCVVCFNKSDIYKVSRELEKLGVEVAVIYGGLPPATKVAMTKKFNDPENSCNVLVATDAVGMGLNLNIKRIVFYSLKKLTGLADGGVKVDLIDPSQALQISGRAGRYGTQHEDGEVTTFNSRDLPTLVKLLQTPILPIEQAGLQPTFNEIQLFSYHLPKATLSNILEVFSTLCQLDESRYFLCRMEEFKFLAETIEHVPMQLKDRYMFCCAPIPKQVPFVATMFLKFARKFSRGEPITIEYLVQSLQWPLSPPKVISDMTHLEAVFDILDAYKWLSFRFPEIFAYAEGVEVMQENLNELIEGGVQKITTLVRNTEMAQTMDIESAVVAEDQEDLRIVEKIQKRRTGKIKPEPSVAQKAAIQNKILAALIEKGLVSEEKLLEEGFISEEVQELTSHRQDGVADEVLENPKWKVSIPDHSTESSDGPELTVSHFQRKDLSGRTEKDLVKTKTDLKPGKNGNKNINFDTSHSEQFSVEKTKDNFNAKSRTTLKENGNPDVNYYKPNFADYIKKVMQARKGNS